jgi:hypothetical protein
MSGEYLLKARLRGVEATGERQRQKAWHKSMRRELEQDRRRKHGARRKHEPDRRRKHEPDRPSGAACPGKEAPRKETADRQRNKRHSSLLLSSLEPARTKERQGKERQGKGKPRVYSAGHGFWRSYSSCGASSTPPVERLQHHRWSVFNTTGGAHSTTSSLP